jgi:hypothetical protein
MNTLFPVPAGQNAYNPNVRMLNAVAESLDTVITPGFVNSILSMGNALNPTDMLLVAYKNGVEFFYQSVTPEGVITLAPANQTTPFPLTNVQYVAKGGSDLNIGNNINAPKLTIPAALSAISAFGLVVVLDSGVYSDPFTLPPNVSLYAPNAIFQYTAASGSLITQPDTGTNYIDYVTIGLLEVSGGASAITQNGALSGLVLNVAAWIVGNASFAGTALITSPIISNPTLTFGASGNGVLNVSAAGLGASIVQTTPGSVTGNFGGVYYGDQTFLNRSISHQDELQETSGRELAVSDGGSDVTIQFNSMTNANYILPETSNVNIPIGSIVTWVQVGAGAVNFEQGTGVTILSLFGVNPQTTGIGAKAFAEKLTDTVWVVSGDIQAVGP